MSPRRFGSKVLVTGDGNDILSCAHPYGSSKRREVVASENRTTGGFFRVEVRTHLL